MVQQDILSNQHQMDSPVGHKGNQAFAQDSSVGHLKDNFKLFFFSPFCVVEYLTHHGTETNMMHVRTQTERAVTPCASERFFSLHFLHLDKQLNYRLAPQNMSRVYKRCPNDSFKQSNNGNMKCFSFPYYS